jgi:DNA-binding transcriptional LysR family regulator
LNIELFSSFDILWLSNKTQRQMKTADFTPQLLNRLRMRQVALLLAVESRGTLRGAAADLGLTQPAATKMLHELEDALGQLLFDRVGRGLQITPAGLCVMSYFRGLRGSMDALGRELAQLRLQGAGKLFVGCIMAASPDLLTEALIRLKAQFPLVAVEIRVATSDQLMQMLREGELDIVIGRLLGTSIQDYEFRPIQDEALAVVVACDHPLSQAEKPLPFESLLDYSWILQPTGSPMREVIEQEFKANHAALPKGLIETSSILTTTNLIAKSDMVAIIPRSVASRYEQHKLLRILPYAIRHTLTAYGSIVQRDRPLSSTAAHFMALLHAPIGG